MSRIKPYIALVLLIPLFATTATAAPADAFFEASTAGATSGPISKFPAEMRFGVSVGGVVIATIVCARGSTTTGLWTIQNSEETVVTSGTKEQKQPATKLGPHEAITITNWGTCTASLGAEKSSALVSPCRLQFAQPKKGTGTAVVTMSIQTDCVIQVSTLVCTITVEQLPANHNLKVANVSPAVNGVEINAFIKGFTYKATGAGCATAGLKEGTEITFETGNAGTEAITTLNQRLA